MARTSAMGSRIRTPRRLSEVVSQQIEDLVVAGHYRPGDKLPTEPELEEQFDVSRTVIREAGRILVERGLVDIRPGRGMVIAEFDGANLGRQFRLLLGLNAGTFAELMEMRLSLEVGMTELAASRHTPEDDELIAAALRNFSANQRSATKALDADLAFHEAIAHASHNPFFIQIVNPINDVLRDAYRDSLGYEAAMQRTYDEHVKIAEAIRLGDEKAAATLSRAHLERIFADRAELINRPADTDPTEEPHHD